MDKTEKTKVNSPSFVRGLRILYKLESGSPPSRFPPRSLLARTKDTTRLIKGLTAKIGETEEAIKTVTAEIAESAPQGSRDRFEMRMCTDNSRVFWRAAVWASIFGKT